MSSLAGNGLALREDCHIAFGIEEGDFGLLVALLASALRVPIGRSLGGALLVVAGIRLDLRLGIAHDQGIAFERYISALGVHIAPEDGLLLLVQNFHLIGFD